MLMIFLLTIVTSSSIVFATDYCKTLDIGEHFTVDESRLTSRTQVPQKYTLKRESEYEYKAFLNLKYIPLGKLKTRPEVVSAFERKVDACFEELGSKLTDETGVRIRLARYTTQTEASIPRPPEKTINLYDKYERADSGNYELETTCEVIVHESLHLLGLVDEYKERVVVAPIQNPNPILRIIKPFVDNPKDLKAYDCRATGVINSAMSMNAAFAVSDSVLYSAQTRAIINPNCEKKNPHYYACARLAYLTSKEHGSPTGCGEIPSICRSPRWLLTEESPLWEYYESVLSRSLDGEVNFFEIKKEGTPQRELQVREVTRQ